MASRIFYKNDGTTTFLEQDLTTFPLITVFGWERGNYNFKGWAVVPVEGDGTIIYQPGVSIPDNDDNYYAIWEAWVIINGGVTNAGDIEYLQELTLDLNSNNAYTTVFAKQADSARFLRIYLTKDNIPYEIDPSHAFYFRMRKPDGHGIINPASVQLTRIGNENLVQGSVIIQLTEQCLAVAGRGYADLVEYDAGGLVLSSIPFIVNIMSAPSLGENIVSNDEFQQLSSLMSQTEALLQYAPAIDPSTNEWVRYDEHGTPYPTGVIAAGKSYYIVDIKTGAAGTNVVWESTSIVLSGTPYYTSSTFETEAGTTTTMVPVTLEENYYYIFINDTKYYVKSSAVEASSEWAQYYIVTIPQGLQGEQGIPGVDGRDGVDGLQGPRGPAGAGGVTWVDGLQAEAERRFDPDAEQNPEAVFGVLSNVIISSDYKTWTWENSQFFVPDPKAYLKIGYATEQGDVGSITDYYLVDNWDLDGNTLQFQENTQTVRTSIPMLYLVGYTGVDSGNVRLRAVSYYPQESFIDRDPETGEEIVNLITVEMKEYARANIDAMKAVEGELNGQVLSYNGEEWEAAEPQLLLNRLTHDDLKMVTKNYTYTTVTRNNDQR